MFINKLRLYVFLLLVSFVKQPFNFKHTPFILYNVSNYPRPTHYECVVLLCWNVHAILNETSSKCGNLRAILHETSNKCGNIRAILHETFNKCGNVRIRKHREMSLVILYLTQRRKESRRRF